MDNARAVIANMNDLKAYADTVNLLFLLSRQPLLRYSTDLENVCISGDLKSVSEMLHNNKFSVKELNDAFHKTKHDNVDILKLLLKFGADEYTYTLDTMMGTIHAYEFSKIVLEKVPNYAIDYYSYTHSPECVIKLLETGLNVSCLVSIDGYNNLLKDLSDFESKVDDALSPYVLKPILDIIKSYNIL
jgi:hypothetical protein